MKIGMNPSKERTKIGVNPPKERTKIGVNSPEERSDGMELRQEELEVVGRVMMYSIMKGVMILPALGSRVVQALNIARCH